MRRRNKIILGAVAVFVALGVIGSFLPDKPTPGIGGNTAASATTAALDEPTEAPSGVTEPTSAPDVTTEPEPTLAPTAEATAEPTPEPTPAPPVLKTTGSGDKIVKFAAQDAPTFARITAKGGGNFAVISYSGSEYGDLLVNEIGAYSGWVYIAAGINRLEVTSSGSWAIEIRAITSARQWDGASSLTGKGDTVVNLSGWPSGITTIKNTSQSNFSVVVYSQEGDYLDLLVNEIGAYTGEVLLPDADPMVLVIHAVGGTWSFSAVEQ